MNLLLERVLDGLVRKELADVPDVAHGGGGEVLAATSSTSEHPHIMVCEGAAAAILPPRVLTRH